MFSSHTKFVLRDGSKIKLWDDVWCAEMALKKAFLELCSIACVKDAFVVVHLDLSNDPLQWNVSFIRMAHD
jgi:hypothetical protein